MTQGIKEEIGNAITQDPSRTVTLERVGLVLSFPAASCTVSHMDAMSMLLPRSLGIA